MCIFTLQEKNKLQIAFILETLELALFYLTILSEVTWCTTTGLLRQSIEAEERTKQKINIMEQVWALDTDITKTSYSNKFKPENYTRTLPIIY